jgi:hypothetical protein
MDDSWSVATAETNGKPLIFRVRNKPPSFARKETFPHLLVVSWEYESPNDQGMPPGDAVESMDQLEDSLSAAFEGASQAFLAVIVTGNGIRAWQWYARDTEETMKLVNKALSGYAPFPVEFSFQEDPEWNAFTPFLESCAS